MRRLETRFTGPNVIASRLLPFSLVGLSVVFAACGGEGLTLPPEGEPARIEVLEEGNNQSGRVNETLPSLVVVRVTDSRGEAVPGRDVLFSFANGAAAGVPTPASARTNADGQASTTVTLGSVAGTHTGTAQVQSAPAVTAEFTVIALPADANGIRILSGDPQSATVNTALPEPLVVLVTDANDNPIPNVAIQWTAEGGGTVSAESNVTDVNGQASVTRTLGGTAGTQTTRADAGQIAGSPVIFTHTATPGSAAGITKTAGDNQSGLPGAQLAQPLVVEVRDGQGNLLADRDVTWVVGTGGGTVNPVNTKTNADGQASTQWTLGPGVGANSVNAVVSGVGTVTFNATADPGAPSSANSEVTASPSTIAAGAGSSEIRVVVRDAGNNPIAGVSVTVASTGSGNSITPASAPTSASGVATFTFSSTVAETKTITATAGGVALNDQPNITVQKTSSIVEITDDEPDPSTVGTPIMVEFSVRGSGGTPTGEVIVTLSGGDETCRATLVDGNGSCSLTPTAAGPAGNNNRRVITATYGGDARFSGDTDTDNHRVNPAPTPNQAPTAAFTAPTCTAGQPCSFDDASTDSDGNIAGRAWTFEGGTPATSSDDTPQVTFASAGSKTVTLTVTDDDGATNSVTHSVTVNPAPVENNAPLADPDTYLSASDQELRIEDPSLGVLAGDTDSDGPQPLIARNPSTPSQGTVTLNPDGTFVYTPNAGALGGDSFTYEAFDGLAATTATVTITFTGLRLK
jgi:adhesin/invasin